MDSPPPQQPQNLQQFLSQVLSQRGPSSLPYSEDTKWLIRQHLVMLINEYPSLTPKTSIFTHDDGTTANLLQVEGTIPMVYGGVTYNVPISVWLIEFYPRHRPHVYVNPTRDMVIKLPHPHVNPSGLVSVPYLHNWIYPSSNLVDLVRNLSGLFGKNPPLYSRGPQSRPSNTNTQNPSRPLSSSASVGSLGSMNSPRVHPQNPPPIRDDPGQVYGNNAIIKLLENLHGDVEVSRKKREGEMEGLFSLQGVLRERKEQLQKGLREMLDEKEGLEQQLQMVLMNSDVLEVWLRENEGKTMDKSENVEVFEPADALSKQMLESTALDLAIEDVIYSLDKAVQEGAIGLDRYLKNVRSLSRDQFFHRATSTKVLAVQMQTQVASMAARAPQYAM